jgi:hypothetical protein
LKLLRWTLACLLVPVAAAVAQEAAPSPSPSPSPALRRFRLGGELKGHFRHSTFEEVRDQFPFPDFFLPPGQTEVFERTASKGSSLEVSTVNLIGEGDLTPDISTRVEVHFIDLYNRNPTTSDDRIALREAWIRFGRKYESLELAPKTTFYAEIGKSFRFSKQRLRRLESYGLWSTAVGRFEELQLQLGGSAGRNFYWRAAVANGNPLFFRDPNALSGDNGTPERVPQPTPRPVSGSRPIIESGFPILYDSEPNDFNIGGKFQLGAGLGFRTGNADGTTAVDALGWYFRRNLAEAAPIRGSFYLGDLTLLRGVLVPLSFSGNKKSEYGLNLEARRGDWRVFAQYVHQDIAELVRSGFEIELAWQRNLNGLFASGDQSVINWIQPVIRFSSIGNDFEVPFNYPAPSVGFDWKKFDLGVRVGIIRGVDFTAEYSRNNMKVPPTLHPDELLLTFRVAF